MRPWCNFVALVVIAASPALPDVVGVSVNGSINATGDVGYVCSFIFSCSGQVTASGTFTVSGTNTALGIFTQSGATSATDPGFGFMDTLSVSTNQIATVTPFPGGDSLSLTLNNIETPGGILGGFPGSRYSFWDASITNDISLTFALTSDSVAFLSGLIPIPQGFSAALLDSEGNSVFVYPAGVFSAATISLQVGTYELVDDFTGGVGGFGPLGNSTMVQSDAISVRFEPVPEPRWTAIPLLLGASLLLFRTKHRWLIR